MYVDNPQALAYRYACGAELEALKPGNVGYHGDGHGMRVADFVTSAAVSAGPIADPDLGVGERILTAVRATRAAVGCNTNLGIVLLAAPLCHAAQRGGPLRPRLRQTLGALDVADAAAAFAAIRLAAPGGLGRRSRHDVAEPARVTLGAAMASAAAADRIAAQYASGFDDVFGRGIDAYRRRADWPPHWRTTRVYLTFLGAFADTHVTRKYGAARAAALRRYGQRLARLLDRDGPSAAVIARLRDADRLLKRRAVNPGTSADLTVATLLAERLAGSD